MKMNLGIVQTAKQTVVFANGAVLNSHKAVQCDKCEMWVHNKCSLVSDNQYENIQNSNCSWICPKGDFFNFSDSFFSDQLNLEEQNRFAPLLNNSNRGTKTCDLFSYGIDGKTIKWIDACLCYRQQRVVVNGFKSDWTPVASGVPQGTVLSPLLFSLHINDITSDIESEIRLFADDCVCYRGIKN